METQRLSELPARLSDVIRFSLQLSNKLHISGYQMVNFKLTLLYIRTTSFVMAYLRCPIPTPDSASCPNAFHWKGTSSERNGY